MKVKHCIIVALVGALTLSLVTIVTAQDSTANVEVRVWQSTQDAESLYISARPEGGSWGDTTRLDMGGLNSRGTYRYGDTMVSVPLGSEPTPEAVLPESRGQTIEVVFRNSSTGGLLPSVKSDHTVPIGRMQLWVSGQRWPIWSTSNARAFEPGEEVRLVGKNNARMEDVGSIRLKTLAGRTVREWSCSPEDDPFDAEVRFTCTVASQSTLASLAATDDADMWVLVFGRRWVGPPWNDEVAPFYIRAGAQDLGRAHFYTSYTYESGSVSTYPVACYRNVAAESLCDPLRVTEATDTPSSIPVIAAQSDRLGTLRCELHEASNSERAVWACAAW